jgi:hypothetical protein
VFRDQWFSGSKFSKERKEGRKEERKEWFSGPEIRITAV